MTLADETTDDEDLIDLTCAKQQRPYDSFSQQQQQNSSRRLHPLQHSPKVTFFDTGDGSASRGEEENSPGQICHKHVLIQ